MGAAWHSFIGHPVLKIINLSYSVNTPTETNRSPQVLPSHLAPRSSWTRRPPAPATATRAPAPAALGTSNTWDLGKGWELQRNGSILNGSEWKKNVIHPYIMQPGVLVGIPWLFGGLRPEVLEASQKCVLLFFTEPTTALWTLAFVKVCFSWFLLLQGTWCGMPHHQLHCKTTRERPQLSPQL